MVNSSKENSPHPVSSSTSSSSSSPPRPPPFLYTLVQQTGHGGGGGSGTGGIEESSANKKRERMEVGGASGSGGGEEIKRKKGELMDVPKIDPTCSICGKKFGSWKAVFGHLRTHPEREWRGAFPPPKELTPWSPLRVGHVDDLHKQLLAPTLLNLATETLEKMREDIDLNKEPKKSDSSSSPPPPPLPHGGSNSGGGDGGDSGKSGFDLNFPPPPEE